MNARISKPVPPCGLRILVVEDDPDALNSTLALLEVLGHAPSGLSSAELAIDRYLDGAFDVIVTDVELPGLSGLDLAGILGRGARIPIVFVTGRPAPAQLPAGRAWLRKPFTVEQMAGALDEVMSQVALAPPVQPIVESGPAGDPVAGFVPHLA